MRHIPTAITALALLAGPATAEGITYGFLSYDYQDFSTDDFGNPTVTYLQGQIDYDLDQFIIGADLNRGTIDNDLGDDDFQEFGIFGGYKVNPQILAGVGIIQSDAGGSTTDGTELFGQYIAAPYGVALNYISLDDDVSSTSLFGEYVLNPQFVLGAIVTSTSEDSGVSYHLSGDYSAGRIAGRAFVADDNIGDDSVFGIRGDYEIVQNIRIGASYESNFGGDFSESAFRLGGSYQFTPEISAEASFGQLDIEGSPTIDVIRALLKYEIGERARLDLRLNQDRTEDAWYGVAPLVIF